MLINFPLLALTLIQWASAARWLLLTPGKSSSGFQGSWQGHSSEKSILAHSMVQMGPHTARSASGFLLEYKLYRKNSDCGNFRRVSLKKIPGKEGLTV